MNKNNKIVTILMTFVIIIPIIWIVIGMFLFFVNSYKKNFDSTNPEENHNTNLGSDTIGKVDEGTNTTYDENGAFLFSIEDVFTITGRGTVVTGHVERGTVKIGDKVQIIGLNQEILTAEVTGIEMFRSTNNEATIGDNAGILLKDITREQVQRGQVLAKPNSIVAAKKFDADVYVLTPEEGGRQTPFVTNYSPQFYFRTITITGTIELPDGIEKVNSGESVSLTTTLVSNVAMEVGTEFSIREGGRTIGKGTVTKVY